MKSDIQQMKPDIRPDTGYKKVRISGQPDIRYNPSRWSYELQISMNILVLIGIVSLVQNNRERISPWKPRIPYRSTLALPLVMTYSALMLELL